jgi:hypothetical protein
MPFLQEQHTGISKQPANINIYDKNELQRQVGH